MIFNQWQVQHRRDVAVRIAVRSDAVTAGDATFGDIHLRLIGDVPDRSRLGA